MDEKPYKEMEIKQNFINSEVSNAINTIGNYDLSLQKHCKNVGNLAYKMCLTIGTDEQFARHCLACGYIHDLGKIGISKDIILNKKILTTKEKKIYQTHPNIAYNLCINNKGLKDFAYFIKTYHKDVFNPDESIALDGQIIRVANEFESLRIQKGFKDYVGTYKILKIMFRKARLNDNKHKKKQIKDNMKIILALKYVLLKEIYVQLIALGKYLKFLMKNIRRLKQIYKSSIHCDDVLTLQERQVNPQVLLAEYRDSYNLKKLYYNALVLEARKIKKLKN